MPDAGDPPENTVSVAIASAAAEPAAVAESAASESAAAADSASGTPRVTEATPADFDLAREALHDITPDSTIGVPAGFVD